MAKQDRLLTVKQEKFVAAYISNGYDAYRAALDAGYSEAFATIKGKELVEKSHIKKRLLELYANTDQRLKVGWDYKINKLKLIIDKCTAEGDKADPQMLRVAISAIAELNKMSGDYAPDKQLKLTVDSTRERLLEAKKVYDDY